LLKNRVEEFSYDFNLNKETENLSSFYYYSTENIYLIKLYECLLELYVRVKCYSKAVCVAESLLIIYK